MLHLRIYSDAARTDAVMAALTLHPRVSGLALLPGASTRPPGDVVLADIPRGLAHAAAAEGVVATARYRN